MAENDSKRLSEAKVVFNTLCSSLDNRKWTYNKDEKELIVRTSAVGDDLTIKLFIKVDAHRSVMYLKSPLPFTASESKRGDIMQAVTIANWAMLNGAFEMDLEDGYVGFKAVVPFMDSLISETLCKYLVDLSCRMVDTFNDKLAALASGDMTLDQFKEFAKTAI